MDITNPYQSNGVGSKLTLSRDPQRITDWVQSLAQAENLWLPSRAKLQILYNQMLIDDTIFACFEKRKNLTLKKSWKIGEKDKTEISFIESVISYCLDAIFLGYTLISFDKVEKEKAEIKLHRRAFYDVEQHMIKQNISSSTGTSIDTPELVNWFCSIETPSIDGNTKCGIGLFYNIGVKFIFNRLNSSAQMEFINDFNFPILVAKTNKIEEEFKQFHQKLVSMKRSRIVSMDINDSIEFESATSGTNTATVFSDFGKEMRDSISRVILGHSGAMDSISGKLGSSDDIEKALQDRADFDAKFVTNAINNIVLPKLRNLGLKIDGDFEFIEDKANIDEQQKVAILIKTLKESGYQVSDDEFTRIFELKGVSNVE